MAKTANEATPATWPVPRTIKDVNAAIKRYGEHQRAIADLESTTTKTMTDLRVRLEAQAAPKKQEMQAITTALKAYCLKQWAKLAADGAKTVKFATGEITRSEGRERVVLAEGADVAKIIEKLKKLKLHRFIRVSEELDKQAILKDPAAVAKVREISTEREPSFAIKPYEVRAEAVAA
jgi:phage host-nuclease inhibitor protein Gam